MQSTHNPDRFMADLRQNYNVGLTLYENFTQAPSKGQFLSVYIKNAYPYSRVA
jgi:hypothetical protein